MTPQKISLTSLPRELARTYPGSGVPSYRDCWNAAVNGVLPAVQERGRWTIDRADLPQIAEVLGLTAPASANQVKPRRRSATVAASATVPA